MSVDFETLPFRDRADLTPYLIHLTRRSETDSALENLKNILRTGKIRGSSSREGFIKGKRKATCLMDVPFTSLKQVCRERETRYEPYGVVLTKKFAYKAGARPVLYLSNDECAQLKMPPRELWRVVRFEVNADDNKWISWLHEREWRCPDELALPSRIQAVLVRTWKDALKLQGALSSETDNDDFACQPSSIIPLEVICQGLGQ